MGASGGTRYYHGVSPGSPGPNIIGSVIRYKLADADAQDELGAVPIPASGINFSWRKYSKMDWTTSPASSIFNLRFFVSGTIGGTTGLKHYAKAQPLYVAPSSSDTPGISGFTDTPSNRALYDETNHSSANPLVVNAGTVLSNPATGEGSQDYVMSQMGVQSSYPGSSGPAAVYTVVLRYDEN